MGERRGEYWVLVGERDGKQPPGKPKRRWEDNSKMDLEEVGCGGIYWIELAQDRDTCKCGSDPSRSIKFTEFVD